MFSPFYFDDAYNQGAHQGAIDLESLFDLLHQHQFYYKENTRPRIVKKLETEDEFQIQIFKPYGNFQNYEVSVIQSTPPLVNVVITSVQDDFQTSIPFNINYIDIDNINWQWYKLENTLVLNIPKRIHFVHLNIQDIINSLLGHHEEGAAELDENLDNSLADHEKLITDATEALKDSNKPQQRIEAKPESTEDSRKKEEFIKTKKQLKAEKKAKEAVDNLAERDANLKDSVQEHEALIEQAVNALKQASNSKQVNKDFQSKAEALTAGAKAAQQARKNEEAAKVKQELEAQRKAAHEKILQAKKELEEIAAKEAEAAKANNVNEEQKLQEQKEALELEELEDEAVENDKKKEYEEFVKQQQEFLKQFFGFNLGPVVPDANGNNAFYTNTKAANGNTKEPVKVQEKPETAPKVASAAKVAPKIAPKIAPKPDQLKVNAKTTAAPKESTKLAHAPSLEEVEDEESVLFKKQFGH